MRIRGYTLLEMVVVVALLALATGLVAPAGYRMVETWREASEIDQVLLGIASLALRARDEGRALEVVTLPLTDESGAPGADQPLELPEAWRIEMDQPLVIRAHGACSNATGTLVTDRQRIPFRIEAPFCRVHRVAAAG